MATTTESKKMIKLYSSYGEEFEIEDSVAKKFRTKARKRKAKKTINLCSNDGLEFRFKESEIVESQTIKRLFDDGCAGMVVHLPKVNGEVLSMLLEYLVKHADSSSESDEKTSDEELKAWDAEFIKVDRDMLFELISVAYDLGIAGLGSIASSRLMDAPFSDE